jgi:hypothetical protein
VVVLYLSGHWNQRYFIVLAGYGIIVGYVGAYMTLIYLYHHHQEGESLWMYFLPLTFIKVMLCFARFPLFVCLLLSFFFTYYFHSVILLSHFFFVRGGRYFVFVL